LKQVFSKECYSDVQFLQLRSVELPAEFDNSIQQTEVKKQDINLAQAEQQKINVELDTAIKSALYQKNVTINLARGEAQSILQANQAKVSAYSQVQDSQTQAYSNLKKKLALKNQDLLKMIKTQVIGEYNGHDMAVTIDSPEKPANVIR
jgi:hypothetical protein